MVLNDNSLPLILAEVVSGALAQLLNNILRMQCSVIFPWLILTLKIFSLGSFHPSSTSMDESLQNMVTGILKSALTGSLVPSTGLIVSGDKLQKPR